MLLLGGLGSCPLGKFEIGKLRKAISSILGTKLSTKDEGRFLINSNIFLKFLQYLGAESGHLYAFPGIFKSLSIEIMKLNRIMVNSSTLHIMQT